ncbi:hypothetical protein MMA231_00124 [Asticcacaulis sp. MM231]|jgi:hypothetical protein|uniref:hypothetical protein n=1 Tax=Asticcacaulis sp. MM231 TaxID=3157666 RepID=UPI0032D5AD72
MKAILQQNRHTVIAWLPTLTWGIMVAIMQYVAVGKLGSQAGQNFFYYSKWFLLALLLVVIVSACRGKLTAFGWTGMILSTLLTLFHFVILID